VILKGYGANCVINFKQMLLTICCASDWCLYLYQSASKLAPKNSLKKDGKQFLLTKCQEFATISTTTTVKPQLAHKRL